MEQQKIQKFKICKSVKGKHPGCGRYLPFEDFTNNRPICKTCRNNGYKKDIESIDRSLPITPLTTSNIKKCKSFNSGSTEEVSESIKNLKMDIINEINEKMTTIYNENLQLKEKLLHIDNNSEMFNSLNEKMTIIFNENLQLKEKLIIIENNTNLMDNIVNYTGKMEQSLNKSDQINSNNNTSIKNSTIIINM